MRVCMDIYFIRTKKSPVEVHCGSGNMSEDITDIKWYDFEDDAMEELKKFDEPDEFCIGKGEVRIEI